ncbi:hypothetical protein B0H66DRAFT_546776 [Apodospora peruviana]|uniref:Heterokaryon incompatibility domain-containing protein n=1 Tax=Apodospora peruviana TaxID=516989 RepID=A0AAE0IV56_9PEZI|nr:hypothetical protein B0H66DRAFT_546776 [Apodospora peruviana]
MAWAHAVYNPLDSKPCHLGIPTSFWIEGLLAQLYMWVDTCCIDKSSSSELEEAINSMFQWYRNAVVCYAFLPDARQASVAQRMSWAAHRITTRREDLAYCLLGILGVTMPMIYGEGDRAFSCLQDEIMRASPDQSIPVGALSLGDYLQMTMSAVLWSVGSIGFIIFVFVTR